MHHSRYIDHTLILETTPITARYTARQAGDPLAAQATKELTAMLDTAAQSSQALLFCLAMTSRHSGRRS
jgi:hypothetical protein